MAPNLAMTRSRQLRQTTTNRVAYRWERHCEIRGGQLHSGSSTSPDGDRRQRRIIRCHVRCASPYALPCSHIDSSGVTDLDACEPCKLPWCFDVMSGPTSPPQESRTFLNSRQDYVLPCRNLRFVTRRLWCSHSLYQVPASGFAAPVQTQCQ